MQIGHFFGITGTYLPRNENERSELTTLARFMLDLPIAIREFINEYKKQGGYQFQAN